MPQRRPWSEACERNKAPILEVLQQYLQPGQRVLEVGSGTGQHAVHFAAALPQVCWMTSDRMQNHAGILAWLDAAPSANLRPPLCLDTLQADWPLDAPVDAVFSANTAHIMSWQAVCGMFRGAGQWLREGGVMLLYGPFSFGGQHVSESNTRFDAVLRAGDPQMGVRDMDDLDAIAAKAGLEPLRRHPMPSNNCIAVWRRGC